VASRPKSLSAPLAKKRPGLAIIGSGGVVCPVYFFAMCLTRVFIKTQATKVQCVINSVTPGGASIATSKAEFRTGATTSIHYSLRSTFADFCHGLVMHWRAINHAHTNLASCLAAASSIPGHLTNDNVNLSILKQAPSDLAALFTSLSQLGAAD